MLVALPFIALVLLWFVLRRLYGCGRRDAVLSAAIAFGVIIVILTESLSIFAALTFPWVSGAWGAIVIGLCVVLALRRKQQSYSMEEATPTKSLPATTKVVLACMALVVTVTGLAAVIAPPNNWDSMTYHMSRVVHWRQNGSIEFYTTHIQRQLYQNPGAEYVIAHLQILSGGDRFANSVQWLSMTGSLCAVSLIAAQIGGDARAQVLASVVTVTIPMGILQASSTQNDYVAAFWLACFVYYLSRLRKGLGTTRWLEIATAGSLGLAFITKATTYIYALPFFVWFVLQPRFRSSPKVALRFIFIITVCVLLLNMGFYMRNFKSYGSPFGPGQEGGAKFTNDVYNPAMLISNAVRNVALHAGLPSTRINGFTNRTVVGIHNLIDADINDPRTTWSGKSFIVRGLSWHEDSAGNPVHLALIAITIVTLFGIKESRRHTDLIGYCVALVTAFLLFSTVLKWQPWHSRLHLPLIVLCAPFVATVMTKQLSGALATNLLATFLLVSALPWMVLNQSRPLLGNNSIFKYDRVRAYFVNRPDLEVPYLHAARFVKTQGCEQVGLVLGSDDYEYPLWVLLNKDGNDRHVTHVRVENVSAVKQGESQQKASSVCAVISLAQETGDVIAIEQDVYTRAWSAATVSVYAKQ